jgi:hypothetical protein
MPIGSAGNEWNEPRELHGVPEFPECRTLNQDGERGDERRALGGRNDVKPNGGGDQPKRKPGNAGNAGTEEGGHEKQREVHWDRRGHVECPKMWKEKVGSTRQP